MFVTLKFDQKCPNCGSNIVVWQTKDLVIDGIYPVSNFLQEYKVNERMDAEAYTHCDKCDKGITLVIKKGKGNARLSAD